MKPCILVFLCSDQKVRQTYNIFPLIRISISSDLKFLRLSLKYVIFGSTGTLFFTYVLMHLMYLKRTGILPKFQNKISLIIPFHILLKASASRVIFFPAMIVIKYLIQLQVSHTHISEVKFHTVASLQVPSILLFLAKNNSLKVCFSFLGCFSSHVQILRTSI